MRQCVLSVCLFVAGSAWAADCRLENGNLNGDEMLDIGDVVYGLMYLFQGGPAPAPQFVADEACAATLLGELTDCRSDLSAIEVELASTKAALTDSQAALAAKEVEVVDLRTELEALKKAPRLTATGQGACYDLVSGQWTEVPCEAASCKGEDGAYSMGCAMKDRFVDNLDGTVTDTCTGLMWQKDTADTNGDGQTNDSQDYLPNWCDALAYCENLDFAGHDDWRLPNILELQSLIDYGRFNPAIDPVFGALSAGYWSSSAYVVSPFRVWFVSFGNGVVNQIYSDAGDFFVRAVRSGL